MIGNGILTLFCGIPMSRGPAQQSFSHRVGTVEELLRFESPSQHTARLANEDLEIGGKQIRKRQAVMPA